MFSFSKFALVATALAGTQLAVSSAQNISSQCQTTLAALVASPDASCLDAQALVGFVASSSTNNSVVPTIDNWLKGLCGRPACTNNNLAAIVKNVTSGCQSELNQLGVGNVNAAQITTVVQTAYPTVRKVACLANKNSSNSLCVTDTLNNVQQFTGPLTVSNIENIANQLSNGQQVPNVPSNVTCTDCVKAAFTIVSQDFKGLLPGDVTSSFSQTCGASFTDGQTPASVTELASNAQSSTTVTPSGAAPRFAVASVVGVFASSLIAVTSAFVLLV